MIPPAYQRAIEILVTVFPPPTLLLIGAHAVNAWTPDERHSRVTHDIDFFADCPPEQLQETARRLQELGYTVRIKEGQSDDPVPLYLALSAPDLPPVDILIATREYERDFIRNGTSVDNFPVPIADIHDLLVMEIKANSEIDRLDIRQLLTTATAAIDLDTLMARANQLCTPAELIVLRELIDSGGAGPRPDHSHLHLH